MPGLMIDTNEEEDEIVLMYSKKWKLTKPKTIKKIIKLFEEKEDVE